MTATLCLLGCQNLRQELSAVISAEGWLDVVVTAFPARCGRPPLSWDELRVLLPEGCTQVALLGCACLAGLGHAPADFPLVRLLPQDQCFNMVGDACLITEAIAGGGYLMTPGWLADWREHLAEMGFTSDNSGEFFKDFARILVLFDTGVDPKAEVHLGELACAIGLPARRIIVGLDHLRLLLSRVVLEWRLDGERRSGQERDRVYAQELADYGVAMDLLALMGKANTEAEVIAVIEELFRTLFAPATCHYLRVEGGGLVIDQDLPADLLAAMERLETPYAWTPSGQGVLLRISRGKSFLGGSVGDRLADPEFRERYLNMVLPMTSLLALAIEDARSTSEIAIAISALRASELRLRSIMDNTSNVVFIKDLEGRYLFVNRC